MQQVKLIGTETELTFSLAGEIDSSTVDEFYSMVYTAYEHDKKDVVFDCSQLTFIDSTTLGTFVRIFKHLKTNGNKMTLINVKNNIRKLFEICSLDSIMEIRL